MTTIIQCLLLLVSISGLSSAAPASLQSGAQDTSDLITADQQAAATPPALEYKCSIQDRALKQQCIKSADFWKESDPEKHRCCAFYLEWTCIDDALMKVCAEDELKRNHAIISTLLSGNPLENCSRPTRDYCEPLPHQWRGEPLAPWMLTTAGIACFLLVLIAIALGIKFC